jgi:hypothetical protein
MADRGDGGGVRDDVEREMAGAIGLVGDVIDRERDAINGDRAFFRDIGGKVGGGGNDDAPRIASLIHAGHMAHAIDMAGHDMPAQFIAQFECGFEIDRRALHPAARHGAGDGFARNIDRKPRIARHAAFVHHRQAYARIGDGCADGDAGGIIGGGNDRVDMIRPARFANGADGGYDACEHGVLS